MILIFISTLWLIILFLVFLFRYRFGFQKNKSIFLLLAQLVGLFLVFIFTGYSYDVIQSNLSFNSGIFLYLVTGIFLLGLPKLTPHFKRFIQWGWEKENLYKLAIIIVVISVLIMAISFIK